MNHGADSRPQEFIEGLTIIYLHSTSTRPKNSTAGRRPVLDISTCPACRPMCFSLRS